VKLSLGLWFVALCSCAADGGIVGHASNAHTREPVRRALIMVSASKQQWYEFTDAEGRFKFPSLVRGEYNLAVHRDGFTNRFYKVELSDFDDGQDLSIELYPQGLITGKVMDGSGQPLERTSVEALPARAAPGEQINAVAAAETNDLGEYRISGIDPGVYRVRATQREGRESEFDPSPLKVATALFGGEQRPSELVVKSGSVTRGIDFVLDALVPARVRGTLRSDDGPVPEPVTLWIAGQAGEGGHNGSGKDGKFEIGDVAPGSYVVSARTLGKTARLYGSTTVKVGNADVNGVEIYLRPSARVEGRIQWEGQAPKPPKLGSIFFMRKPPGIAMGMEIAKPLEDGTFSVLLDPGDYDLSFDTSVFDVKTITLDEAAVVNWKIKVEPGATVKKLYLVVQPVAKP
jgi:Carboxypeptidase regulatory-like domain